MEENDLLAVEWFALNWSRPYGPAGEIDYDVNPTAPPPPDPSQAHLAIVYRNGLVQFMRNENDPDGIVSRLEGFYLSPNRC